MGTDNEWDSWYGPGGGALGGLVPVQPVLIRDEDLIGFVTGITAYPTGFSFVVRIEGRWASGDPPILEAWDRSSPERDGVGLVVTFADGQRWSEDLDRVGGGLVRREGGTSSGDAGGSGGAEYWLPSLPPSGPVQFEITLEHPATQGDSIPRRGLAMVEGELLQQAARRAVDLWD